MAVKLIRIATRQSPLALWQADFVATLLQRHYPGLITEKVTMLTRGDKILDAPLAKVGGKGLFVKELEQGMLEGRADIAVHSMKDVPVDFPPGLHLPVILSREDPRDAFVSNQYASLAQLPANAKIGTSSLRRQCQIKEKLPNADIIPLRGNVNTRLAKLDAGDYDAIILASAGLLRLDMAHRITQYLDTDTSLPAIGQGAIGIECRSDDEEINRLISPLHDMTTALCVLAERAMNERLNGGCQVPIAGYAEMGARGLMMRGLVGSPDGQEMYRSEGICHPEQGEYLGRTIAEDLLTQGADRLLQALYA